MPRDNNHHLRRGRFSEVMLGNSNPVAYPRFGQDLARMCGVLFNFLTQLVYHHAKALRLLGVIRPQTTCKTLLCVSDFPC